MKIDMNTIVKRFKGLQPGALIAIMVGASLVVGLAGWFLLVRPQGAKVKDLKAQATEVQAKIDAYHQQVAAVRAAPKIEVADVYRLAKAMPDRTDMPDLLLELSQLARDTGIRFDSISPQSNALIGSYTVLPISVTFQGNFYNLADFLYRLRSLVSVHAGRLDATGRLFSVDTLTFNESTLKFPQIQATLVIDAFVYGTGVPRGRDSDHDDDHDHHHLDYDRDGPERRVRDRSSLMAKKQLDPLKAKQQKQKKILAVLGVVFLGVAAFMGPKLWKQLHPPPLPPRVIPANGGNPVAAAPTLAAPTLGGAEVPGADDDRRFGLAGRGGDHRPGRPALILQPLCEQGPVLAAAQRRAELSVLFTFRRLLGRRLRQSGPSERPRQRSQAGKLRSSRSTGRSTRLPRRPTSRSRARPTRRSFRCSTSSR